MTPTDQLKLRALRILNDGLKHSAAAIAWAMGMTGDAAVLAEAQSRYRFTARELSLGATIW